MRARRQSLERLHESGAASAPASCDAHVPSCRACGDAPCARPLDQSGLPSACRGQLGVRTPVAASIVSPSVPVRRASTPSRRYWPPCCGVTAVGARCRRRASSACAVSHAATASARTRLRASSTARVNATRSGAGADAMRAAGAHGLLPDNAYDLSGGRTHLGGELELYPGRSNPSRVWLSVSGAPLPRQLQLKTSPPPPPPRPAGSRAIEPRPRALQAASVCAVARGRGCHNAAAAAPAEVSKGGARSLCAAYGLAARPASCAPRQLSKRGGTGAQSSEKRCGVSGRR